MSTVSPLDKILAEARAIELAESYERRRSTRDELLLLKRIAGRVSKSRSVRDCLGSAKVAPGQQELVLGHVGMSEDGQPVAGFSQVTRCGLANLCPWCARKVREERAKRINDAVVPWLKAGGRVAFAVYTISAPRNEPIWVTKAAISKVSAEYRKLLRREGFAQRAGVAGTIGGWEFTVRLDGSGHPHRNEIILFTEDRAEMEMRYRLPELWVEAARACGRRATFDVGMRIQFPELDPETGSVRVLAEYASKGGERWGAGQELTRADLKRSRDGETFAPFDLLRGLAEDGDVSESSPWVKAWRAYERASKGTAVARFSKGLEDRLARVAATCRLPGAPEPEEVDEEVLVDEAATVAEETELVEEAPMESKPVVAFGRRSWRFVHRRGLQALVLRWLEDMAAWSAETGIVPDWPGAVRLLLEDHGADDEDLVDVGEPPEEVVRGPFDD